MMMTDAELLERVEAFLIRSRMTPTRFGLEAMNEGGLVTSLRGGRSLSLRNANKVLRFIVDYEAANTDESCAASPDKFEEIIPCLSVAA